jgi:hypothetical protein
MEGSILVASQSGFSPQFRKPSFVCACNSKAMKLRVDVTTVLQASSVRRYGLEDPEKIRPVPE